MEKKTPLYKAWDSIGHLSVMSWIIDLIKAAVGPAAGIISYIDGLDQGIPTINLIAASLVVAGATIWLINQLTAFFERYREGYAYGLAYESACIGLNPNNAEATLQLGICVRNASRRPIRYKIKRFDTIVGNKTITHPKFENDGGIIPSGIGRTYSFPSFPKKEIKEFLGKHLDGRITFEILYGHPDANFVRCLEMQLSLSLNLALDGKHGVKDIILSEVDRKV